MSKQRKIFILALSIAFFSMANVANAGLPKFDIALIIQNTVGFGTTLGEKIAKGVGTVKSTVNNSIIGKGVAEYKNLKNKLGESKLVSDFNSLKDKADKGVADVKGKIDDGKSFVDDKVSPLKDDINSAKSTVDKAIGDAESFSGVNAALAKELTQLEYERNKIVSDFDNKISLSDDYYSGLKVSINDSVSVINSELGGKVSSEDRKVSLTSRLDAFADDKSKIESDQAAKKQEMNSQKKAALQEIDAKILAKRKEIEKSVGKSLLERGKSKGEALYSKLDIQKLASKYEKYNFLKKDEPETSSKVRNLVLSRAKTTYDNSAKAQGAGLAAVVKIKDRNEQVRRIYDAVDVSEGKTSAGLSNVDLVAIVTEAHLDFIDVLSSGMLADASFNIYTESNYTLAEENTDVGTFDLSIYDFSTQCGIGGSNG